MISPVAPCTNQIVNVILGTQCIQCIWLNFANGTCTIKAYSKAHVPTPITFAQPTLIEQTIRSFLHEHEIPHAFVTLALKPDMLHQRNDIPAHQLLACQLLAINTPFHCAGITTYTMAQQHALSACAKIPLLQNNAVAYDDLLCSIGCYSMARK